MEAAHEERVRELERELEALRARVEEKENTAVRAAELGQALLRENEALEERLNQVNKEATQKIEELEQERFSLQQKLECQKGALQAVQHEAESTKTELRTEFEMREEHLKQAHSKKVHELELLVSDLRGENERLETQVKSAKEKASGLEERLREMSEQAESAVESSQLHPEIRDLENMCRQERSGREEAQAELTSLTEDYRLLEMELEEVAGKVEKLTEECQERSDQANQWYKTLQASKEQVLELNAELDSLKMEMGNGRGSSGNSLFGEVDDRRLQVERKYVSLQVKHDSLEKRHNSISQQYKRLKAEMSSLLCQFSVVGADAAHIRRLEMALRQAQSEKESLVTKLHKLEKQQASVLASQEKLQYVAAFGDKKEYIALIETQLRNARKENSSLTKEKEMKGLQLVWETQKLRETEGKLHRKEQEMARGQKEVSVMKMRLHELQEKLEKAESGCRQQEAQVKLLERELETQRSLRGPSRRQSTINPQQKDPTSSSAIASSASSSSSAVTSSFSKETSSDLSNTRHSQSLAGELAVCDSTSEGREIGGGGKEKENRLTKSPKKESRKLGAVSFLEEVEREFEKKANQQAPAKNTQTFLVGNRPNSSKSGLGGVPVYPKSAAGRGSKVNQCPQQ